MDVSIIIVNYNTKEFTRNCLKSLFEQTKDIAFEVLVSDNGSKDGSIEMIKSEFPQVILIENNENLGFGAANNRGLKKAKGKYIFYLNSDTVLLNNAVKIFFDYWENYNDKEKIGGLGCNLLSNNGEIVHSYSQFPTYKSSFNYLFKCFLSFIGLKELLKPILKNRNKYFFMEGKVDFIVGAALFLKNDKSALFDERFFMYYEETDLQFKLKERHKERLLIKEPKIIHFEGGSTNANKYKYEFSKITSIFYWSSCYKYLEKNDYNKFKSKLLHFFISFIYSLPQNRKLKQRLIEEMEK